MSSQHIRRNQRKAADKTKRTAKQIKSAELSTATERAAALIYVHETGGNRIAHSNAFVQDTGSRDTIDYVAAGLEYLSRIKPADEGVESAQCQFGRHLLMQTMVDALKSAGDQIEHERKVANARGVLEGAKAAGANVPLWKDGAK